MFGIGVSNLANDINPEYPLPAKLNELIDVMGRENIGLELQLEFLDEKSFDLPAPEPHMLPFLGVHLPIVGVDYSDPAKIYKSIDDTNRTLEIARDLNADYVVVHLTGGMDWDHLVKRPRAINKSLKQFMHIARSAKSISYKGPLYLENLEFPLFPSTRDEIAGVMQFAYDLHTQTGISTGIALDLAHIWHSGNLIAENKWRGKKFAVHSRDPFASGKISFIEYLKPLIQYLGTDLKLVHMTGTHKHETHLLPSMQVEPEHDDRLSLNLHDSLREINAAVKGRSQILPVVNEAHGRTYQEMKNNCKSISEAIQIL